MKKLGETRPAGSVEAGTCILGRYIGAREVKATGEMSRDSLIYTFRPLGPSMILTDYWGGAAMLDRGMMEAKSDEPILIIHRGKEARENLRKGKEINVIDVIRLENADIIELNKAGVNTDETPVDCTALVGDIIKALKLPPLPAAAAKK